MNEYTIGEVPSLKKHMDPSCTLIILIHFLQNNSKWYMQAYQWAVGGHIIGQI